ncbi:MAG: enolase C-terminal domain-like protein [Paracoccaceae bacterium]|nr:enolase C-terminal domain-like protein [Paracoccaceae bacterium]
MTENTTDNLNIILPHQIRITEIQTHDIRFPTSLEDLGTDAVHIDCDYSATYVKIFTDHPKLVGVGLTFTIGKGNDLCAACIDFFKPFILNKTIADLENKMHSIWRQCTNHSQLRWMGPEKGVVHLAVAALFNGIWDLISKYHNKPLWKYIIELNTNDLLDKLSFTYLDDAISRSEAFVILENKKRDVAFSKKNIIKNGFPCYTTAAGWLGYSDEKMTKLIKNALANGWTHFKMKVGQDINRDIKRLELVRKLIGPNNILMIDANQVWSVHESIEYINKLKKFDLYFVEEPTNPDDVLGFRKIKDAVPEVNLATGEMCQNRIMFKQFLENGSLDFCQIDSCRMASLNEIIPIMLLASKLNIPLIPHAGGVGLCEYVQHLNIINDLIITSNDIRLSEYAESCAEHIENPAIISNGHYVTPLKAGYSAIIKQKSLEDYNFPSGKYWKSVL